MNDKIKVPHMETIRRTAEIFKLPVHFVRQKANSGEVVAVRAGRKILVNVEKFAEYLNGSTAVEAAPHRSTDETAPRIAPISLR